MKKTMIFLYRTISLLSGMLCVLCMGSLIEGQLPAVQALTLAVVLGLVARALAIRADRCQRAAVRARERQRRAVYRRAQLHAAARRKTCVTVAGAVVSPCPASQPLRVA